MLTRRGRKIGRNQRWQEQKAAIASNLCDVEVAKPSKTKTVKKKRKAADLSRREKPHEEGREEDTDQAV